MCMMFYFFRRRYFILSIAFIVFANNIFAQDTTTSDGLYTAARKAAFDEDNYNKAIRYCQKALTISPTYTDINIFLGRLYTWTKKQDSAAVYFNVAIKQSPGYIDAYVAYADMEYWQDHYAEAINICDIGLAQDPRAVELLLRKAKNLFALKDYKAANLFTDSVLSIDNKNADARALAVRIKDDISKNKVSVSYDYVHFDKQFADPWHLVSVDYTRQTKAGSFTGRVNYANRFNTSGIQYEVEAYPHISKTFYGYVSAGYSDSVGVFPQWRAGASLYANLPKSFEAEVGIRYLYFSSSTVIYTLYVGKYYSSYLFGARTYIVPGNTSISQSYSLFTRYYFGGAYDYVGASIGYGISPDERAYNYLLSSNYKLTTYKAAIELKKSIKKFNIIGISASFINEEYLVGVKGNQIQAGISYQHRF